jgi:predicted methyltransferase
MEIPMTRFHARFSFGLLAAFVAVGPAMAATDAALQAAIHAPDREAKFVARDSARHPEAELEFFGLRPDANVVEISPGGGYWTEILVPYLAAHGTYTAVLPVDAGKEHEAAAFKAKFVGKPGYPNIQTTTLDRGQYDIAPAGSADFVLTFRNVHNWMYDGYADEAFAAFFKALKPGGVLGVEEHRGLDSLPQDPKADNGYVRQDYVIALAKKAGFVLAGSSEISANPKDTKIWPKGVWTLPPTYALGSVDRAKYAAIGEADNMVLKFRKPAK